MTTREAHSSWPSPSYITGLWPGNMPSALTHTPGSSSQTFSQWTTTLLFFKQKWMVGLTRKHFRCFDNIWETISKHTEGHIIQGYGMAAMDGDSLGISGPKEQSAPGFCWELALPQLREVVLSCIVGQYLAGTWGAYQALAVGGSGEIKPAWPLPFKQLVGGVAGQWNVLMSQVRQQDRLSLSFKTSETACEGLGPQRLSFWLLNVLVCKGHRLSQTFEMLFCTKGAQLRSHGVLIFIFRQSGLGWPKLTV